MKKLIAIGLMGLSCTIVYAEKMPSSHSNMMMVDNIHGQNADVNFVKGMIEHHKGAVKMSEQELQHGKDPQIRQLAQSIIKAQNQEIQMMEKWLKTHPEK